MIDHVLTDKELETVLELLESESKRLTVETRRTDARELRKQIRERERVIDRLIERFHEMKAGDLTA